MVLDNCSSNPIGEGGGKMRSLKPVCATQRFVPEGGGRREGRKGKRGGGYSFEKLLPLGKVSRPCATVKLEHSNWQVLRISSVPLEILDFYHWTQYCQLASLKAAGSFCLFLRHCLPKTRSKVCQSLFDDKCCSKKKKNEKAIWFAVPRIAHLFPSSSSSWREADVIYEFFLSYHV